MNAIGFVFFILSVLSLGMLTCLEKQISAAKLRSNYLGHLYANREILNQCESKLYQSLKTIPSLKKGSLAKQGLKQAPLNLPLVNPECARLNLFPLLAESHLSTESRQSPLYHAIAKLLKTFYGTALFGNKTGAEYRFLDALLKEIREANTPLEKISLPDPSLQKTYYKMLKGTKYSGLYPSLLEFVKIDPDMSLVCMYHAHPDLFSALFDEKVKEPLYQAIHMQNTPMPSPEEIDRICLNVHVLIDPTVFSLLNLSRQTHPKAAKTILVGADEDTGISLKKTIVLPKNSDENSESKAL